jgi:hypothetical protein
MGWLLSVLSAGTPLVPAATATPRLLSRGATVVYRMTQLTYSARPMRFAVRLTYWQRWLPRHSHVIMM